MTTFLQALGQVLPPGACAQLLYGQPHRLTGMFGSKGHYVRTGQQHRNLIDIQVGHDRTLGNGRVVGEVIGADQTGFLARESHKQD